MKSNNFLVFLVLIVVGLSVFVIATVPTWNSGSATVNYTTAEGQTYTHRFSNNISDFNSDVNFTIDTATMVSWSNASGTFLVSDSYVSSWIKFYDANLGDIVINATFENQTGFFVIPIQATNTSSDGGASVENFEFVINATNDAPNFTSISSTYLLSQGNTFFEYINASDEELHYPLDFNLTFVADNCTHASWSGLTDNQNCSLLDYGFVLSENSNTSASMNYTPTRNLTGVYYANFSVKDFNSGCPHSYCDPTTYETNLTTYYSVRVKFTINSNLSLDVSNCTNATLMEGNIFNCTVNVTTVNPIDSIALSSYAAFNSWSGNPYNRSWFYPNSTLSSSNYILSVPVSINVTKREVGNWTVNFSAYDGSTRVTAPISIFVNFTEDAVSLDSIPNIEIYENYSFELVSYDDDLWIRDGSLKQENLTFRSNESWVIISSVEKNVGDNFETATIDVDYDYVLSAPAHGEGNYSVLINVTDVVGNLDFHVFNISVLNDTPAEWNSTLVYNFSFLEDSSFFVNLTNGFVNDSDGDNLTFSFTNTSEFEHFNLTSYGVINFTPSDSDVGYHNITINAYDGKLNSYHVFNFTILNVVDSPRIDPVANVNDSVEGIEESLNLVVYDDDLLILVSQKEVYYNESLSLTVNITNLSVVESLISYSYSPVVTSGNRTTYQATFTPTDANRGNYSVVINVSDHSGAHNTTTYNLTILRSNDAPTLETISNFSRVINETFYFDFNATDEEDSSTLPENGNLTYVLSNLTVGGNFLTINSTRGIVNLSLNQSYAGVWHFNLTVNDTDGLIDFQDFWLKVYDFPQLNYLVENSVFNLIENVSSYLNFSINHSVLDNLSFEFFVDGIYCSFQNNSNCNYTGFVLRDFQNSYGNGTNLSWSFTPNFTDESYGNYKNLTLVVYPNSSSLNSTQRDFLKTNFSFYLNVSHTNFPVEFYSSFSSYSSTYGSSTPVEISLVDQLRDYDYIDSFYLQNITFNITTNASNSIVRAEVYDIANRLPWTGFVDDWSLQIYGEQVGVESLTIQVNDSLSTDQALPFKVAFTAPAQTTVEVPRRTSGGGGATIESLKHYSLKIISPQDVIISDQDYIDVPFSIQNNGQVDLVGINLSSVISFNNQFSDNIKIVLTETYIPSLKFGQNENFTMRIIANTQKSGKYKATIYANVTSPKFEDWGDFYIELKKVNESEAEQMLIFTSKMVADNPECLELTENLKVAQDSFLAGDFSTAMALAEEVISSCEDSISANEQISFPMGDFIQKNLFFISLITAGFFVFGFIFYVYRRVRFNKSRIKDYV